MAKKRDEYDEFYDEYDDIPQEQEFEAGKKFRLARYKQKEQAAMRDEFNEVGAVEQATGKYLEKKIQYETDYVSAHQEVFTRSDIGGSISLFTPERQSEHLLLAKHCLAEIPQEDYFDKEDRRVIFWENPKEEDNEYFDNIVGCLAGLFKLGCEIRGKKKKQGTYSIKDYIDKQKQGRND